MRLNSLSLKLKRFIESEVFLTMVSMRLSQLDCRLVASVFWALL